MKILRKLLFPFSILYGIIVSLRNKLYDWRWKKSVSFSIPVICIGNLSVGGTGKSPMIEYLLRLLKDEKKLATLSRGYKRESEGFYLLNGTETGSYVGDEPLQFKTKFPEVKVAVDEQRVRGIQNLLKLEEEPEVVLLDDAFQHRKVQPSHSILLTTHDNLYAKDLILPAGNLREPRSGAKRADLIVVTKCKPTISAEEMLKIKQQLKPLPSQKVFFSAIKYSAVAYNIQQNLKPLQHFKNFTLVTGIAKPQPFVKHLKQLGLEFKHLDFPDHYNFKRDDLQKINKAELILTTEKDFMRLKSQINSEKLYYLPIEVEILNEPDKFNEIVKSWVITNPEH